jgi:hypothetical protein
MDFGFCTCHVLGHKVEFMSSATHDFLQADIKIIADLLTVFRSPCIIESVLAAGIDSCAWRECKSKGFDFQCMLASYPAVVVALSIYRQSSNLVGKRQ